MPRPVVYKLAPGEAGWKAKIAFRRKEQKRCCTEDTAAMFAADRHGHGFHDPVTATMDFLVADILNRSRRAVPPFFPSLKGNQPQETAREVTQMGSPSLSLALSPVPGGARVTSSSTTTTGNRRNVAT